MTLRRSWFILSVYIVKFMDSISMSSTAWNIIETFESLGQNCPTQGAKTEVHKWYVKIMWTSKQKKQLLFSFVLDLKNQINMRKWPFDQ